MFVALMISLGIIIIQKTHTLNVMSIHSVVAEVLQPGVVVWPAVIVVLWALILRLRWKFFGKKWNVLRNISVKLEVIQVALSLVG